MRIAVFHNLPSGGAKRAMIEMLRQLRQAGHVVEVFIPSTADEHFLPSSAVANRVTVLPAKGWRGFGDGSRAQRLAAVPTYVAARRDAERVQLAAAQAIDHGDYDVAFVHHDRQTQSPSVLRYLDTPSVYFCQEPLRSVYEAELRPGGLLDRASLFSPLLGIARLDRQNARAAGQLLANSFYSRESILRAYGLDATVVYLGVDTEVFRPSREPKEEYVLSVGTLHYPKGHRLAVEAIGRIPNARRPPLRIIGDKIVGREEALLRALAARHDVALQIQIGATQDELVRAYQRARLLVFAPHLEPFGLVAIEAAACATPVVGVREAGLRESIIEGATGILVDNRDAAVLADAIDELLGDSTRLAALAGSALETVRSQWTWSRTGAHLEAVLLEVSGPSRADSGLAAATQVAKA